VSELVFNNTFNNFCSIITEFFKKSTQKPSNLLNKVPQKVMS